MYLHIGKDSVVRSDDILGIFDIERSSISAITKEYLAGAQHLGVVINVTDELPKSFIICIPKGTKLQIDSKVYISQISTTTLFKRAQIEDVRGL